jgi:uncharacterized protein with HEPN domain
VSRALYERLCDIKERCEQLLEDVHGDPGSVARNRVLAKAVLYDLQIIGEACSALPEEFTSQHAEVDWKGWKDFQNLTTHVYWRADATIAAETTDRAIPVMVAMVAAKLPAAAQAAAEMNWSLAAVGDRPDTDDEVQSWWGKQRR